MTKKIQITDASGNHVTIQAVRGVSGWRLSYEDEPERPVTTEDRQQVEHVLSGSDGRSFADD